MSDTPTPETDAEAMDAMDGHGDPVRLWDYKASKDGDVVPIEFARRLERERNASTQLYFQALAEFARRIERERNEARMKTNMK